MLANLHPARFDQMPAFLYRLPCNSQFTPLIRKTWNRAKGLASMFGKVLGLLKNVESLANGYPFFLG
jgi:hypothetical protein